MAQKSPTIGSKASEPGTDLRSLVKQFENVSLRQGSDTSPSEDQNINSAFTFDTRKCENKKKSFGSSILPHAKSKYQDLGAQCKDNDRKPKPERPMQLPKTSSGKTKQSTAQTSDKPFSGSCVKNDKTYNKVNGLDDQVKQRKSHEVLGDTSSHESGGVKLRERGSKPRQNTVLRKTLLFENKDAEVLTKRLSPISPKSKETFHDQGMAAKNKRDGIDMTQNISSDCKLNVPNTNLSVARTSKETNPGYKPGIESKTEINNLASVVSDYENVDIQKPARPNILTRQPEKCDKPDTSIKPKISVISEHPLLKREKIDCELNASKGKPLQAQTEVAELGNSNVSISQKLKLFESANNKEQFGTTIKQKSAKNSHGDIVSGSVVNATKRKQVEQSKGDMEEVPKKTIQPHIHLLTKSIIQAAKNKESHVEIKQHPNNNSSNELKTKSNVEIPVKPHKPPRTYAHETYAKEKVVDKKNPAKHQESVIFHKYEDIEEFAGDKHVKPKRPPAPPTLPRRPPFSDFAMKPARSYESITEVLATQVNDRVPNFRSYLDQNRNTRKRLVSHEVKEDWIPRHTPVSNTRKTEYQDPVTLRPKLRRSHSDEAIYVDAAKLAAMDPYICKEAVYNDPALVWSHRRDEPIYGYPIKHVKMDKAGYAIPDIRPHKIVQRSWTNPEETIFKRRDDMGFKAKIAALKRRFGAGNNPCGADARKKLFPVKQKISRAFSVLRKYVNDSHKTGETIVEETEDTASVESESVVDEQEHKKRMKYVASVKEKNYMTLEYARIHRDRVYPKLFEYALVVGLQPKKDKPNLFEPYIMHKFPEEVSEDNQAIPQFCFPDCDDWQPTQTYNSESFSFVLTNIDGSRLYGYCMRLLPPGYGPRLPEVYCIISPLGAHDLYSQVLDEIESRRDVAIDYVLEFIAAVYSKPIPSPGKYVHIRTVTPDCHPDALTLRRQSDARLDNVDFETVFHKLGTKAAIEVFASMLLERRVLFTASKLSTLSDCIHAMVALLYPFTWWHTFIPVLPASLIDIVCSPTPYIIGILSSCKHQLGDLPMEEVLIVDLDNGNLLQTMGDEDTIIPKKLQKALKTAIHDEEDSNMPRYLVICEAFMRLFVETVGHYEDFIVVQQNGQKVFQKESFIKSVKSKSLRMFVEWFCETQMFEVYMTDRVESIHLVKGLFEERIAEYQEEMTGDTFKDNVKEFGKKMKNLGKAIKNKLKDGKTTV